MIFKKLYDIVNNNIITPIKNQKEYDKNLMREFLKNLNDEKVYEIDWTPLDTGNLIGKEAKFIPNYKGDIIIEKNIWFIIKKILGIIICISIVFFLIIIINKVFGLDEFFKGIYNFISENKIENYISMIFLFGFPIVYIFGNIEDIVFSIQNKIIFDIGLGIIYKKSVQNKITDFSNIHSIQLLKKYILNNRGSIYNHIYELNLIFKDNKRYNISYYYNELNIINESKNISKYLGVPVWNAINLDTTFSSYEK